MNTTPTKDINVHEYPEGADDRTLLAYRIAVMQAFLDGAKIEASCYGFQNWRVTADPYWMWDTTRYRVAKPEPRYFRSQRGLFGTENDKYCVEIVAPDTTTFVYEDGRREIGDQFNSWTIERAEKNVREGHWAEFDGNMAPFVKKPEPAPQERLSAKILRLLGELPEQYREQALSNFRTAPLCLCDYELYGDCIQTPADAVEYGFLWRASPEGWNFWYRAETEVRSKQR